jgi:hypothetical protein
MLSYKEYKLLNESLYGAFNLGLKGHSTVGGIVSDSSVNGTEAALEAESEEAIEEAKKGKKMKKKMFGDEEEVVKKVKVSDEDHEDKDSDDDHEDEDEDSDDDHDDDDDDDDGDRDHDDHEDDHDEDDDDDHDEEKSDSKGREFAFMKKKSKKHMKKKSKKEWSEVMSDLEDILEAIDDEEALLEVKKGLQMMKKGMQKGVDGAKAANDPKSQIDKSIEYHGNRNMKKHMGCGTKKCGKYMNEEEQAWWQSVNGMLGSDPNQKNWDGGWKEVGEVEQAVRENTVVNEFFGMGSKAPVDLKYEYSVERFLNNAVRMLDDSGFVAAYGSHDAKPVDTHDRVVQEYKNLFYKYRDELKSRWDSEAPKTHSRRWFYADNWVHKDKESLYKLVWAVGRFEGDEEAGRAREVIQKLLDEVVNAVRSKHKLPSDRERIGSLGKQMGDRDVSGRDYRYGGPRAYVRPSDMGKINRGRQGT